MSNIDFELNHFVLFSDGVIEDLYDPRLWQGSASQTVTKQTSLHGTPIKAAVNPLGLFTKVVGIPHSQESVPFTIIAESNWSKLFWLRHQFECFLGYANVNDNRGNFLAARSKDGIMWSLNVIDC